MLAAALLPPLLRAAPRGRGGCGFRTEADTSCTPGSYATTNESSVDACCAACAADARCQQFTFHSKNGHCDRVGGAAASKHHAGNTCGVRPGTPAPSPPAAGCASPADCGLNGECDTATGRCICDPGWTSPNCTRLDLLPARWGPSRQAYMTNFSSWGGNVVRGADGQYHLFFSEMAKDGLHQFKYNCQASHAVGTSPLGPFTKKGVVRGPVSHNVQPQVGPDGAIYIFMIGSSTPGDHGPTMVGRAEGVDAEWEFVTPELTDSSGAAVARDNPSAVMFPNGTVLLATRGAKGTAGVSLFVATGWRGPYRMVRYDALPCAPACKVEDPFLWRGPRGLHMLAHDHEPFPFHKQALTYAFTADPSGRGGWVFSGWEAANGTRIEFDDGSRHTFCSRQRPQLFFSAPAEGGVQRGRPLALITGAQHGALTDKTADCGAANSNASEYNPYADYSFTFAQPVAPA